MRRNNPPQTSPCMQSAASEQVKRLHYQMWRCAEINSTSLGTLEEEEEEEGEKKKAECEQTKLDAVYLTELRCRVGESRGVFVGFRSFQAHGERC